MGVGIRTSDLLVLLDVPANRRARAHRLPVETDLRVLHLDLPIVQRPALRGHTALTRAADLHRGDHHVGELVLHVGLLVPAGAAEREHGGGEVIAGGAGLGSLGRRLVEQLLDGERAHVAALAGEGARGGHGPGDGLRDAPAEREDLDLVLVLGVVGLALDSIDLQEYVGWHGEDPFCWEPGGPDYAEAASKRSATRASPASGKPTGDIECLLYARAANVSWILHAGFGGRMPCHGNVTSDAVGGKSCASSNTPAG